MNNSFNGRCFACNRMGHLANQCRSRGYQSNLQRNVVCYNYKRSGHIAKFCRNKNQDKRGPEQHNHNQDKGKGKVNADEIQKEMNKIWMKRSTKNVGDGSALESGANNPSEIE